MRIHYLINEEAFLVALAERGRTLTSVGEALGSTRSYLSSMVNGRQTVTPHYRQRLMKELKLTRREAKSCFRRIKDHV